MAKKVRRKKATHPAAFVLRMKGPLRARLGDAAQKNSVSLNTEICMRLESTFARESQLLDQAKLLAEVRSSNEQAGQALAREFAEVVRSAIAEIGRKQAANDK